MKKNIVRLSYPSWRDGGNVKLIQDKYIPLNKRKEQRKIIEKLKK